MKLHKFPLLDDDQKIGKTKGKKKYFIEYRYKEKPFYDWFLDRHIPWDQWRKWYGGYERAVDRDKALKDFQNKKDYNDKEFRAKK